MVLTTILSVLLTAWIAQAQYRHKVLLEDRIIHQPVTEQDCTVCHDPHFPEGPGQTLKSVPELCFGCHKDPAAGKKFVHAPLKKEECLSCHYPHSAPVRGLLQTTSKRLCVRCHSNKKGGRHGKSRFGGDCLQCHDPHASSTPNLIKAAVSGQCGACHTRVDKDIHKHSALDEYECEECHNPHESPPEPIITCDECHDEKTSGANVHPPLEDGCDSCHEPHSGPHENQLQGAMPELCLECHDEMDSGKHGRAEVGMDCLKCHDPHSSRGPGLLVQTAMAAPCTSCHAQINQVKNQHTPVRNEQCQRCHDPHSPDPFKTRLCQDCHLRILDARYDHDPAVEGCDNCHETHGSDLENNLIENIPVLCLQCHPDQEAGRHGSVDLAEECGSCHDPHSSFQPDLLIIDKETVSCKSCHKTQMYGSVVHSPILDSDCDECHDPHADPPEPTIECLDCHESLLQEQYQHDAAADGCADCHETHSGEIKSLLIEKIPAVCIQCHDDKEGGRHGGTVLGTECGGCHEPHSSSRKKLLKVLDDRPCSDCHKNKTSDSYVHSALNQYQCQECHDPHADPPGMPPVECRTCHLGIADRNSAHGSPSYGRCVECHDPHGSDSPSLLKKEGAKPADDCVECHRDIRRMIDNSGYLHEPLAAGECTDCHTVHEGDSPFTSERFDTRKNVPYNPESYALCFKCHPDAMVQVRFTETETGFRHKRWNLHNLHVVRDGERGFSCWVCHNPHSSRQPHLLSQETPVNSAYSLKVEYRKTREGGKCRTNCHTVQEYKR